MKAAKTSGGYGRRLITAVILVLAIFATNRAFAQLENKELTNYGKDKEFFYLDPLIFYNQENSSARLDVYVEVPMSNVQFIKKSSEKRFEANLEYDIIITDQDNQIVSQETNTSKISKSNKEFKNASGSSEFIIKNFYLQPGDYDLQVEVVDKNSGTSHTKTTPITVGNFSEGDLHFSDIMMVSNYSYNAENKKTITPLVTRNVGDLNKFYLFFEVYNNLDIPLQKSFRYEVYDKDNNEIMKGDINYVLSPGVNQKIEELKTDNMLSGDYKLIVKDNNDNTVAKKDFNFKWSGLPISVKDLDLAISQTIYIATSDEYDKLKKAKTKEDKEKKFIQFWKSKDPSPGTARNELMQEYYKRIEIANERYSNYFEGWKSDMGMVYIIYGDPSNIERHPFEGDSKPYEIWDYYDINRRFVFVDNTGFGDYRLTTPIWDDKVRAY
ncbi:MAG: GWxTD domain-containing protein [Ignavibacteriae bacterium]|nr:GWxTD domain-containing protein [Ignavibacteriota bacterium]MCB0723972.1 GWxTD domain-containing protein [Ignavibacteriota bacterium]MCB9243984.1 GWxTD domain-containing protein [Ignavibacteriales bacterium]